MKKTIILILGLLIVGCFLIGLFTWNLRKPQREMERIAYSMIGHSEVELLKALGQPRYVVTTADLVGRTVDYPWQGMNFVPVPNHPVRNKVLLYSKFDVAIYVYVDDHGMIEYVARAGT